MAHFIGHIRGSRGPASRLGGAGGGLTTHAASWSGAIHVRLYVDKDGRDCFRIEQTTHQGVGCNETIAEGVLGEPVRRAKARK